MIKNREQTTQTILQAVGQLLARSGFRSLGINAIAREAGVDKVLIYRYFGGLAELLRAFASQSGFWPNLAELFGKEPLSAPYWPQVSQGLIQFVRALRSRPNTLEILRWEMLERNELTDALAEERERQGLEMLKGFPSMPNMDVAAVATIISAGLTYLCLRAKTADQYNGIALNTDEGWSRIEEASRLLVRLLFEAQAKAQSEPSSQETR